MLLLLLLVCLFAIVSTYAALRVDKLNREVENWERRWADHTSRYKVLSGSNFELGRYFLVSLDGGKSWGNVEANGDKMLITGPADPELLERALARFAASQELYQNTKFGGDLDLSDPKDLALLEKLGFTIKST